MSENSYFGFIHWPRLWAVRPPCSLGTKYDPSSFDPKRLEDEVWSGGLGSGKIPLKVYRDGSYLFDFQNYDDGSLMPSTPDPGKFSDSDEITGKDERRCEFLNAYLLCLYTKLKTEQRRTVAKMAVAPNSLVIETAPKGNSRILNTKGDAVTGQLASASYPMTFSNHALAFNDWRVFAHPGSCVYKDTLDATAVLFSQILDSDKSLDLLYLFNLQIRAYVDFEQRLYSHALSQTFMIAEFVLRVMCPQKKDGKISEIITNLLHHKAKIPICGKCGSDFRASKCECLSGSPTENIYEGKNICINRVRVNRNNLIHDHKAPKADEAAEAIRLSDELIYTHYGISIGANLERSMYTW